MTYNICLNLPLVHKNVYHHLSARLAKRCPFTGLKTRCVRNALANLHDPLFAVSTGSRAHLFYTVLYAQL